MSDTIQQYVEHRAELLANLVLTRKKNVHVLSLGEKADLGIDLIARIMKPISNLPANPYFGVQVKGTSSVLDDEHAANRFASQAVRAMTARAFILAPVVLMVFSMEGDRGYWGWVMQPFVGGSNSPALTYKSRPDMMIIDNKSIENLFSAVSEWFEAMGQVLQQNREGL